MTNVINEVSRTSRVRHPGIVRLVCSLVLPLLTVPLACSTAEGTDESIDQVRSAVTHDELMSRWAPIVYQSVTQVSGGNGLSGKGDFITSFDYDGDFTGQNNWDNMNAFPLYANVYASVSESTTHYFIYYTMFHPRSWANTSWSNEHENDAEGAVMLVRKDGTTFGKLEAVITAFHNDGRTYRASPDVVDDPANSQNPGQLTMEAWGFIQHPQLFMEAEGHGLEGCTASSNCGKPVNTNLIRYAPNHPSQPLQVPELPIQGTETVGYRLIDLDVLYRRRYDRPTFASPANMAGDRSGGCGAVFVSCSLNSATGIWAYGVAGTPETLEFGLGKNPAKVFGAIFNFNGAAEPSEEYLSNKFMHPKCDVGERLQGSPDACVQQICATDSYCCTDGWDAQCKSEVTTICARTCDNCNACICTTHDGPIGTGCEGVCRAQICDVDPYCCNTQWDSQCVGEVSSICNLNCGNLAGDNLNTYWINEACPH